MSKNKNLPVYELIHSLSKNEKRYFSLLIGNSGNSDDKKVVKLFNHLNKVEEYDESKLLKQVPEIKAEQLANQKAYLYQKILQALRLYNSPKIIVYRSENKLISLKSFLNAGSIVRAFLP